MTSGVTQALPQVLTAKTGAEGKAARSRAPQADFAEALGKSAKQPKSGETKADRREVEAKPLWQRLAAKLETAAGHSQEIAARLDAAASAEDPVEDEQANDRIGKQHTDGDARDAATPATAKFPDVAQAPSVPAPGPAEAARPTVAARRDTTNVREGRTASDDGDVVAIEGKTISPSFSDAPQTQDSTAPIFVPMGRGEQSEPVPFEPAARPVAAPAEQSSVDLDRAKEALPDASAEPSKAAPRVTVLAQHSIPAPMPSTAIVLVESIAASDLLNTAGSTPALDAIHASATHASAQSLKIQLHPAELGMVTATLRFAGEQLSIELQVENHEAYRHLSSDSDTIVSSLRDLGYEVDRVTVLQPQAASTPAVRSDTGASLPSPQGRTPEQFGSGVGPGGNGGSGGRQSSDGGNPGRNGQHHAPAAREQQGSGLYI